VFVKKTRCCDNFEDVFLEEQTQQPP